MSRLLEKGRLREQQANDLRRSKCVELTERLKNLVHQQEITDGYISHGLFSNPEIFPTDCPEYQGFTSMININKNCPLKIFTDGNDVDSIKTKFDLEKGEVSYNLYLDPINWH